LFKRILLTAVLGAGLVLSVPFAATADHRGGDRDRRDWGIRLGGAWGYHPGLYSNGEPAVPNLHFNGFDRRPDVWWYPAGYGAGRGFNGGGYYPGRGFFGDVLFTDDYYGAYGYRCNGYRDGYYYGPDGDRLEYSGRPFYRRNADCEDYFHRHGSWYGYSDCSRFEVNKGYCDDYDRHGHQRF
jgi:hypothetical protein